MSNVRASRGIRSRNWDYEAVRDCITVERLRSYLVASGEDLEGAFEWYEWNIKASTSVMGLVSVVEVVVRNALDREMRQWCNKLHGTECWFDHVRLDARGAADLAAARARARGGGTRAEVHGKVIAELSLGFWRYLVESRYYASIWVPAAHKAFPGGASDLRQRQRRVAKHLQQLQFVRNRAAHHEPIHRRDFRRDLQAAAELTLWVSPHAQGWMESVCTLRRVVASRPVGLRN
ncbi:hypothetical protein [Antribacter gilvus]|uniref:hypothetical protein n=1 Tax=Antribacter gilvus TaxID=2304675 RepID=UPI000F76E5C8|nr:hypothetical protein [Antribacter gilvus]